MRNDHLRIPLFSLLLSSYYSHSVASPLVLLIPPQSLLAKASPNAQVDCSRQPWTFDTSPSAYIVQKLVTITYIKDSDRNFNAQQSSHLLQTAISRQPRFSSFQRTRSRPLPVTPPRETELIPRTQAATALDTLEYGTLNHQCIQCKSAKRSLTPKTVIPTSPPSHSLPPPLQHHIVLLPSPDDNHLITALPLFPTHPLSSRPARRTSKYWVDKKALIPSPFVTLDSHLLVLPTTERRS